MALFAPITDSLSHLEFTSINQSIAVVNTDIDEYRVLSGTYQTSNGAKFDDLQIICNKTNVWTYKSTFEYAVDRKCYYSMYALPDYVVSNYTVSNIPLLPKNYDVLYQVDNPADSMQVFFDLVGEQRHATQSGSSDSSSSAPVVWGNGNHGRRDIQSQSRQISTSIFS